MNLRTLSIIYARQYLAFIKPTGTEKAYFTQIFMCECCQRTSKHSS